MSFINELKRRNVIKVAAAYVIVAWLVLQVGEVLAPALHLPEWTNSALAFFLILGFPVALIFAWAFELTPEGLKREKDVDRGESISHVTGRKLDFAVIALLVLALGYFVADKFWIQPRQQQAAAEPGSAEAEAARTAPSIAVLPFADMSPAGDNEYFSDGLTEELLNILARIRELQVAGRTSSFAFKGQNEDLRGIGEKLGVNTILEGSVRKDDERNRVRITAQLINVEDGFHLWSETYDRELDDIFAIQEEIAHEVAGALKVTLLGEDAGAEALVASTDLAAYDHYLQGLQGVHEGGYVSLERAVRHLQQALTQDPDYLPAKLTLVQAWAEMANTGAITRAEAVNRGLPLVEAVLAEHTDNAEAHLMLAMLRDLDADSRGAEAAFNAALRIDPRHARALQEYGRFLFERNQTQRGMELLQAAAEIEPYAPRVLWDQCQTNAFLQNTEVARRACERLRELSPESPLGYYGRATIEFHQGNMPQAMKHWMEAIDRDPEDFEMLGAMALFWTLLGDFTQAESWLRRAEALGAGQPVPLWSRLRMMQAREQHDQVRELVAETLARDLEQRLGTDFIFRRMNAYENLRSGRTEAALAPYRKAFPWAFADPLIAPDDAGRHAWDLVHIAGVLKVADPLSQRPGELLRIVEDRLGGMYPNLGLWADDLTRAGVATLRGERSAAVAHLEAARDKHMMASWPDVLLWDPVFSRLLVDEPGYRELVAWYEAETERQREEAYRLLEVERG